MNHHRLRIPLVLALASWLCVGASDPARDAAPPPSPEFKRPANALFADDFSDSTLRGWRAPDSSASAWSVRNGVLRGDVPDVKQARAFLLVGDSTWTDYAVDVDVCGMRGADKGVGVRVRNKKALGVDVRGGTYQDVMMYVSRFRVGGGKAENPNGSWSHLHIEIRGSSCLVRVGDHVVFDNHLRFSPPPHGGIALAAYAGGLAQCTVYYDNVVVTPLAAASDR